MKDQREHADPFRVEFTWGDSWVTVSFAGALDGTATRDMQEMFSNAGVAEAPCIEIDLTQATFLDSGSVGVLVSVCRQKRESGGTFSVICRPGRIRRRFEVFGLIDYLDVRDSQ